MHNGINMSEERKERDDRRGGILGYLGRLVVTAIVLAITSFLTPGFSIVGLWPILIAAVVISLIDYGVEKLMGVDASPFGKGFKGFVITAIILYIAQFLVPSMSVTIMGAIIAAVVIGILDALIPGRAM